MTMYTTFCDIYYSEALEQELAIYYDVTDYDPSVGVDWEFEWDALDENDKDRRDNLPTKEYEECERLIYASIQQEYLDRRNDF